MIKRTILTHRSAYTLLQSSFFKAGLINKSKERLTQELTDIYCKYDTIISQRLAASKSEGKKLLIAIGEEHYNRKSLIIELVIAHLARKNGIHNCALELNNDSLAFIRIVFN